MRKGRDGPVNAHKSSWQKQEINESRLYDLCITSTLSIELLEIGARNSSTALGTRIVSTTDLPLLTMQQSRELFLHFIALYNLKGLKENYMEMMDGQELMARMFTELSGGHPKSIEFWWRDSPACVMY